MRDVDLLPVRQQQVEGPGGAAEGGAEVSDLGEEKTAALCLQAPEGRDRARHCEWEDE